MLSLFFYKNTPMKKLVKKLHKAEAERTKVQKIVRDVAFFWVVVYAAVMTFMVFTAEADKTEAELGVVSTTIEASHVALAR